MSAIAGVFEGVIDQDPEQLLDGVGVAVDDRRLPIEQVDLPGWLKLLCLARDILDDGAQVERKFLQVVAGICPRQGEKVLHQAAHPLALLGDVVERRHPVLVRRPEGEGEN